ncbi:hypothetical protein RhiirC2_783626 [Rhizophagus irregularis]|uniref:Uncharacterized protein n=1 Tax=Rhizophagus irregularis TaxID=588596 RepID=A0A2N1N0F2_9GLOM|nr:hypothetical protein RhiirC2_783626 [Rhizophagus irregularis]
MSNPACYNTRVQTAPQRQVGEQVSSTQEKQKQNDNKQLIQVSSISTVLITNNMINCSGEAAAAPNFALKKRYGELEENGVYVTRRNPYQPNKQIFYATYKKSASADAFYGQPILWVYNEMLYITLMELSLDKREERRAFCAKINGLPPNAN